MRWYGGVRLRYVRVFAGNPVTYQQIHATGVSCALAKSVIVRGGKYHAKAPAGWTYINGKFLDNGAGNCGFTWKRGADRITGWIVIPRERVPITRI